MYGAARCVCHSVGYKMQVAETDLGTVLPHNNKRVSKTDSESNPVQWSDFSQVNLRRAREEREASGRLRGLVSSTLSRTSADLREQADRVEEALARRVAETEEAVRNVEIELKEVI